MPEVWTATEELTKDAGKDINGNVESPFEDAGELQAFPATVADDDTVEDTSSLSSVTEDCVDDSSHTSSVVLTMAETVVNAAPPAKDEDVSGATDVEPEVEVLVAEEDLLSAKTAVEVAEESVVDPKGARFQESVGNEPGE